MTTTTNLGRAAALREATAEAHSDTESMAYIGQLMSGELDLDAYISYLAQYAYVYRALETRAPNPDDPAFLANNGLARFDSIAADLKHLGAGDWETNHPPLPATQAYVARINEIHDDLPRYVAHHYTRYLGDLSGGQVIAKRVARNYGATPDQLSFYRFDKIDKPGPFKVSYREGIDALAFDDDQDSALFEEAIHAFHLNADLFEALGDS